MSNENPAISVIVPVYNAEKYIDELLSILQGQTFQDFEIIAVDDCSNDNSCAIIESFVPNFGERLKLLKLERNSGSPSVPRNKGLEIARGKYIFLWIMMTSLSIKLLKNYTLTPNKLKPMLFTAKNGANLQETACRK